MRKVLLGTVLAASFHHLAAARGTPCAGLAGLGIAASEITLPTTGAQVTAAAVANDANGAYCRVLGAILPVDPAAPRILFQANLPATWNGRALQYGGGGCNGRIPNTTGLETHGRTGSPSPLARGFPTFGSDSGHQSARNNDASFATNEQAVHNFGYAHIRKTPDAVRHIATAHDGQAPRRLYFNGGSTGGREGLTAAIRWPEAYGASSAGTRSRATPGCASGARASRARCAMTDPPAGSRPRWSPASRGTPSRAATVSTAWPTGW